MRKFLPLLLLGLAVLAASACTHRRTVPLVREEFPPTPQGTEIRLYVNAIQRPHIPIAVVQSFSDASADNETKRRQLENLQELARARGADAVMDIQQMTLLERGMIEDPSTPFPSLTQGTNERYILRGTAIRFLEEGEEVPPLTSAFTGGPMRLNPQGTSPIPRRTSGDPQDDSIYEEAPRGLGSVYR